MIGSLAFTEAHAAKKCFAFADLDKTMKQQFKLQPRWKGISDNGNIFAIYSDAKGGGWIAIRIDPTGKTGCMLVGGRRNEYMIGQET